MKVIRTTLRITVVCRAWRVRLKLRIHFSRILSHIEIELEFLWKQVRLEAIVKRPRF